MSEVKSDLYIVSGPAASPVSGIDAGGHLRAMKGTYKGDALASGDKIFVGKLPPGALVYPHLSRNTLSGSTVTIAGGTSAVVFAGGTGTVSDPLYFKDGGDVVVTTGGTVAADTAVITIVVFAVVE